VKATPLPVAAPKPAPPPATIAFSTLDFSTSTLLAASALNPKKKNRHDLPKDANAALAILAGRKDKLDLLNPEQRERVDEKERWEKVGLKAGGEKVRDDEKRLKKMAKRQEKVKSKSAKAWYVPSVSYLVGLLLTTRVTAGLSGRRLSRRPSRPRSRSATTTWPHERSR
jgi:hypothetical protein